MDLETILIDEKKRLEKISLRDKYNNTNLNFAIFVLDDILEKYYDNMPKEEMK